jgi:hypothetical protein
MKYIHPHRCLAASNLQHTFETHREFEMPAIVTTNYLGGPEIEEKIRARVEDFFKDYLDDWRIDFLGKQFDNVWELTVTDFDGRKQWVRRLYGDKGGHDIQSILRILEKIAAEISPAVTG